MYADIYISGYMYSHLLSDDFLVGWSGQDKDNSETFSGVCIRLQVEIP